MTTGPPTADTLFDRLADVMFAGRRFLDDLSVWSARAVHITIVVNGVTMPIAMPDDDTADAVLTFSDRFGDNVPEPGPVTWNVTDTTVAVITPDPTDDTKATVKALAGSGTFRITANSGTLSGQSDDITIEPGAPAVAQIAVTLEPPAAPA